uniref:Uncharacterized protein n=1 Tax=Rangifer tarandus platyrhynchus TaxID=3082113 RepID=A0ACB0E0T5_RANTA|nr:unnamed protein product [Rangifer tarandus platyrhynchus]
MSQPSSGFPRPPRPGSRPELTLGRGPGVAASNRPGPGIPRSGGALGLALGVFSLRAGASGGDSASDRG